MKWVRQMSTKKQDEILTRTESRRDAAPIGKCFALTSKTTNSMALMSRLNILPKALVLILFLFSCSKAPVYENARFSIEPAKADFGTMQASDPIAFHDVKLTITNLGKETLKIESVEFPKGFSYTIVPRKTIESGNKVALRITIDIRKFSGSISETAYVLSNDPTQPRAPINLEANILGSHGDSVFEVGDKPDIEFDHRAVNFGTIGRHQTIEHNFEFKNVGKKTLKILSIESRCQCISGQPTLATIPPGDSAAIVAKLEAFKWNAYDFRKSLFISTNDPDEPGISLTIVAKIIDALMLEPRRIILPGIQPGKPAIAEAKLYQKNDMELVIKNIESSSPWISATSTPLEGDQKGYLLTITIIPTPDMAENKFEELITIYTDYRDHSSGKGPQETGVKAYIDYSRIDLPVKGSVAGAISVTPQTINFGSATAGESLRRKLFVSSATSSFEIKSLSITNPEFRATYSPVEPGKKYEIDVEFSPGTVERQIEDKLVITTSNTTIVVPIFASTKSN
jgi:hypothetical protein